MFYLRPIRYTTRNFKQQLNLNSYKTFKGFRKRLQKKYPKTTFTLRFLMAFSFSISTALLFLPGNTLPLQQKIKLSITKMMEGFYHTFFMNPLNSNPVLYTRLLYANLEWLTSQKIYEKERISNTLKEANETIQHLERNSQKKHGKSLQINNISHSVLLLFNLIEKNPTLLKDDCIIQQYEKIVKSSILPLKNVENIVQGYSYAGCFKIFEYLLSYSKDRKAILSDFSACLGGSNGKTIAQTFRETDELKKALKKIYGIGDKQQKEMVLKIFESIDNFLK